MRISIFILLSSILASCGPTEKQIERKKIEQAEKLANKALEKQRLRKEKRMRDFHVEVGEELLKSDTLQVKLDRGSNSLTVQVYSKFGDSIQFPEVKERFGGIKPASYLKVTATLYYKGKNIASNDRTEGPSRSEGYYTNYISFGPQHFKEVPVGNKDFVVEIESEWVTSVGYRSRKSPFTAKLSYDMDIEPIYKSKLFFKSLILNKKQTMRRLGGGNDFRNSTPEACISISVDGKSILYTYSKNSYTISRNYELDFYHVSLDDPITLGVYDADYVFNRDDLINDTTMTVKDICFDDYQNIPLYCTDELVLYCTSEGQINK